MEEHVASKIDSFFANYPVHAYPKGQILLLKDDPADYVYYLIKGKVKQYDVSYRGDEIILNVFKPPAFFPMSLAVNQSPSGQIFEAENDVEARRAPAQQVVAFIKENPDVMFDLLSRIYRGMDGMLNRMTYLMGSSAKRRLTYELVIEARRFGTKQPDGSYVLAISEKDLGARAGLTRETVSREARKLKKDDSISITNHTIVIKDLTQLEAKLQ